MSGVHSDDYIQSLLKDRFKIIYKDASREELFAFLEHVLQEKASQRTQIVSLVGGPGSGKSTISAGLIASLSSGRLKADVISTDDYNIGDREWRWQHF